MRCTILGWSTLGGAFLGMLAGVLILGVAVLVIMLLPPGAQRTVARLGWPAAVALLAVCALVGGALGYQEGRLKL